MLDMKFIRNYKQIPSLLTINSIFLLKYYAFIKVFCLTFNSNNY